MNKKLWGAFATMFGATPRNRILEFFLETRELDFSIGDVAYGVWRIANFCSDKHR